MSAASFTIASSFNRCFYGSLSLINSKMSGEHSVSVLGRCTVAFHLCPLVYSVTSALWLTRNLSQLHNQRPQPTICKAARLLLQPLVIRLLSPEWRQLEMFPRKIKRNLSMKASLPTALPSTQANRVIQHRRYLPPPPRRRP